MIHRPQTLVEVAVRSGSSIAEYDFASSEFLDEFYLDDTSSARQRRIDACPDASVIAEEVAVLIGATAEHLACRWGLMCPQWVDLPEFMGDGHARFYPADIKVRPILIVESPPAFRRRMIFTVAEPLVRARFPGDPNVIMPFDTE